MLPTKFSLKRLGLVALLLVAAAVPEAQAAGISWFNDLEKASEAARRNNRPMMVEFWADWCTACKVMEKGSFNDPKLVAAVSDRVIPVRIHFDLQKDLVRKYNVPALPYLVFTNSNGTELLHHRGILNAEELTALIKAMPADVSELNRLDRILQEDKNNFEALVAMGRELRAAGFFEASNRYYGRAIQHDEARKDAGKREVILSETGQNLLVLRDAKLAAEIFERCLKEFPDSPNAPDFLLNLAQSYVLDERKSKARKTLDTLIVRFPQSEASLKARALMKSL